MVKQLMLYWGFCIAAAGLEANAGFNVSGSGIEAGWDTATNAETNFPPRDEAERMVATNGFVYLAGYTGQNDDDFLTAKFTTNGALVWTTTYNGIGNGLDRITGLAVGSDGRVVVTGRSYNTNDADIATLQYDASGTLQWIARFDGGNLDDDPAALALDASDQVTVAGQAGTDLLLLRYSASGATQWVSRFSGDGGGASATALALAPSGRVAVVGVDYLAGFTGSRLVTLLYDSSGTPAWTSYYSRAADDYATASDVAVDGSGTVYVAGQSLASDGQEDLMTLCYNASGVPQWVSRYNGSANGRDLASAIAVGGGLVTVAGQTSYGFFNDDVVALQFTSGGATQWVAQYAAPGGNAQVNDLALGGTGEVFLACEAYPASGPGTLALLLGLGPTGGVNWASYYEFTTGDRDLLAGVSATADGSVYAAGSSVIQVDDSDATLFRFGAAGTTQWVARLNGPGLTGSDEAKVAAALPDGGAVVAGLMQTAADGTGVQTIRYSNSGAAQWSARLAASEVVAVAVDAAGFVTVATTLSTPVPAIGLVRYDAAGTTQWLTRVDGASSNAADYAGALALAGGGAIVAGQSYDGGLGSDMAVYSLDTNGLLLWSAQYDGPFLQSDYARAVAVDTLGNVVAGGNSWGGAGGHDMAVVQFSSLGATQWVSRYDGAGFSEDFAGLAVDGSNNVIFTGSTYFPATSTDFATVKVGVTGETQWAAHFNGPVNGLDVPVGVAVDAGGDVYVAGYQDNGTDFGIVAVKYSSSGATQWISHYEGSFGGSDTASSVKLDAAGHLVVAGTTEVAPGVFDAVCLQFAPDGTTNWIVQYDRSPAGNEGVNALAVAGAGLVVIAGTTRQGSQPHDFLTLALRPPASSPTGYSLFALAIDNPALRGYADDPDGDGYANVIEYVTGGNPTNSDVAARMDAVRTNGLLALRFQRDTTTTDATLVVEAALAVTNQAAWTGLATNSGGSWGASPTVTESGSHPATVTVHEAATTNSRFMRLRVIGP